MRTMNRQIIACYSKQESDPNVYLDINNAGICYTTESDARSERPAGRNDYQFIYVRRGTVRVNDEARACRVTGPAYLLYRPFEPLLYTFCHAPESEIYWVHFHGNGVEDMLSACGITGFSGAAAECPEAAELWARMVQTLKTRPPRWRTACNADLLRIFSLLPLGEEKPGGRERERILSRVEPALREMHAAYGAKKTVEEYARMCYMSKFAFIRLFRQATGMPPIAYINHKRLEDSLYLLTETDARVEEIAAMLGYDDAVYFGRLFRRAYGMSPTQYRRRAAHAGGD